MSLIHKFYDAWIDETGPFARLESYAEQGMGRSNLELMVKLFKGMASKVKASCLCSKDLGGEVVGESLADILEPLSPKKLRNGPVSAVILFRKRKILLHIWFHAGQWTIKTGAWSCLTRGTYMRII